MLFKVFLNSVLFENLGLSEGWRDRARVEGTAGSTGFGTLLGH